MPDLSTYTGRAPNDFAIGVIRALEAEGFKVAPTEKSPVEGESKTLRITWRGVYIGSMRENLWMRRPPFACLYHFPTETQSRSIAKAPEDFDKIAFARQHGCDPEMLRVDTVKGESYLWVQDEATSLLLMRDWAGRIDKVLFGQAVNPEDGSKSETERLAEVAVRLVQREFRFALEQEFGRKCAVTQLDVPPILRASHIVPWKDSDDRERKDPNNGLLLSANLDALFDRYLITFLPSGKVVLSMLLTECVLRALGPVGDLLEPPGEARAAYLRRHNAEFERIEAGRKPYVSASSSD